MLGSSVYKQRAGDQQLVYIFYILQCRICNSSFKAPKKSLYIFYEHGKAVLY